MLNLDTHIFLHAINGDVTRHERALLTRNPWGVSAIVLWEIEKLYQKGRIRFGLDSVQLAPALDDILIWPITADVCLHLRALDFRSDSADEIIAATSLTHNVPLLTRDEKIRTSRLVRCV